ncbi:DNA primase, partial [Clavibacter californiensis]
ADRSGGAPQGRHAQGGHGPDDDGAGDASRSMSLMDLPTDLATRLERDALMAMLQHPELVGNDLVMRAAQVTFVNESLAVVRDGVIGSMDALGGADWLSRVALEVPESFATLVKQLGVAPLPNRGDADKLAVYVKGVTAELVGRDLLRRKADLIGRLQRTDATHDRERYQEIQRELMQVEAERRALRE